MADDLFIFKETPLVLPIKGKWFYMLLSGEKPDEYREIKPYYTTRLDNHLALSCGVRINDVLGGARGYGYFLFRNGYAAASPYFLAPCSVRTDYGNPAFGGDKDTRYYCITPLGILETGFLKKGAEVDLRRGDSMGRIREALRKEGRPWDS